MPRGNPIPIKYYVNERGCHICTSHACDSSGYPRKRCFVFGQWVLVKVVKYLWQQVNGSVPEGLVLRHSCDETKCINLEHVLLGTQADNVADRVARGRSSGGSSKLTEENVRFIRANVFPNGLCLDQHQFVNQFDVSQAAISYIVNRKIWKHVE